ncbi:MAG TPA: hypothetical protein VLF69_02055 [Candidatus Saccharimonadales bacterium]|nr:hypothetical protein [Candidatus Saccharimonadales bacterium]
MHADPNLAKTYTTIRILQRLSLLTAGLFTLLGSSFVVCLAVLLEFIRNQKGYQGFNDPTGVQNAIDAFINGFFWITILAVASGVTLTSLMLIFKSQRAQDRKTIIDSLVILGFCAFITVFSQTFLTDFIRHLSTRLVH